MECGGKDISKGRKENVDDCATACTGVASLFAFGTNDFGKTRCDNTGCTCLCETSSDEGGNDGTCETVSHKGYRLYSRYKDTMGNAISTSLADWQQIAEKKECKGSEVGHRLNSIDDCATACKGVASLFAFGTNDFENNRCYNNGCDCLCETAATSQGTCEQKDHDGYRLYKYSDGKYHVFSR